MSAPATSICAPKSETTTRALRSEAIARKPPSIDGSARLPGSSREWTRTRAITTADQRKPAAATPNRTGVPATIRRTAQRIGPANAPNPSIVLVTTFAAASCAGSCVSEGISAAWAGEDVDTHARARGRERSHPGQRRRAGEIGHDHHALAPETVAERGCEW